MVKARWLKRLQGWSVTLLAMLIATVLVAGLRYESPESLIAAAVLLSLLHEFVRPLLFVLTLPLLLVTLTLFRFVINAMLLGLVGWLVPGFEVAGFWAAFWGALVMSLVMALLQPKGRLEFNGRIRPNQPSASGPKPRRHDDDDVGGGPVIDV